jgi:hypothetical protein
MLILPKTKKVPIRKGRNGDPRMASGWRTSMHRPGQGKRHFRMAQNPQSVEEVRKTLGVLGYQRPFIQGFASIARPLHDLTKKGTQFNLDPKCTDALDELIKRVTTEPVLWHPDPAKPYELEVDASAFALGSILYQRDDNNKRRAVAYHSKALNQAERNYSIGDREFLAIIEGLKRVDTWSWDHPINSRSTRITTTSVTIGTPKS